MCIPPRQLGSVLALLAGMGLGWTGRLATYRSHVHIDQNDATSATDEIAALNHPEVEGNLLVRVRLTLMI